MQTFRDWLCERFGFVFTQDVISEIDNAHHRFRASEKGAPRPGPGGRAGGSGALENVSEPVEAPSQRAPGAGGGGAGGGGGAWREAFEALLRVPSGRGTRILQAEAFRLGFEAARKGAERVWWCAKDKRPTVPPAAHRCAWCGCLLSTHGCGWRLLVPVRRMKDKPEFYSSMFEKEVP